MRIPHSGRSSVNVGYRQQQMHRVTRIPIGPTPVLKEGELDTREMVALTNSDEIRRAKEYLSVKGNFFADKQSLRSHVRLVLRPPMPPPTNILDRFGLGQALSA